MATGKLAIVYDRNEIFMFMFSVEVSRPTGTIFLLATPKLLPASFIDDRLVNIIL